MRFSSRQGTPGRHKVMGTQEGTGHWAPGKAQDTGDQGRYRVLGTRGDTGHWGPGDTQGTGAPGRRRALGTGKAQGAWKRSAQNVEKLCHRQSEPIKRVLPGPPRARQRDGVLSLPPVIFLPPPPLSLCHRIHVVSVAHPHNGALVGWLSLWEHTL